MYIFESDVERPFKMRKTSYGYVSTHTYILHINVLHLLSNYIYPEL